MIQISGNVASRVHDVSEAPVVQDFHFAFPATSQYTPRRLRWAVFSHFLSPFRSRATPAGQEGASPVFSGYGKTRNCFIFKRFLGHLSLPSLLRPVWFPFAGRSRSTYEPLTPWKKKGARPRKKNFLTRTPR